MDIPRFPTRGVYGRNEVYKTVTGWKSFDPWLPKIQNFNEDLISEIASSIPPEWYGEWDDVQRLVENLIRRRSRVEELIWSFAMSSRKPFVNWAEKVN